MKNWNDDDILDYLMTSNFDDNLSPEELKSLLIKFRQFYRISANRFTNIELERKKFYSDLDLIKSTNESKINEMKILYENLNTKYNGLIERKLSFKERLFGKIFIDSQ
jgi:hypothetical protein